MRRLGELVEAVESETAQGGRAVSYQPLGVVWLALGRRTRSEGQAAGQPEVVERLEAVTRMEPRLAAGRIVRLDGQDWRIRLVDSDRPRPGRATLSLERSTR